MKMPKKLNFEIDTKKIVDKCQAKQNNVMIP